MFIIEDMIIKAMHIAGVKLTKLQKILLIVLAFELFITGMIFLGRMVGHNFLWYRVESWMIPAEGFCSAVTLPSLCRGIWRS